MERKIETHTLHAFGGRTLGYAALPDNGDPYSPIVKTVHAAVRALVALDGHVGTETQEGAQLGVQIALKKARLHAQAEAEELAAERRAFYAPPASADPAMDAELRAYVRGLPDNARAELMREVGAGHRPEVLHALARFPAPDPLAETARGLLKAHRETADPDGVQALRDREAALEWSDSTVTAVESIINDATTQGTLPAAANVLE